MRAPLTAIVLGLLTWTLPVSGAPRVEVAGVGENWHRYESPHFELFSRNGPAASRQLLHSLELLHTVFLETFHMHEVRPLGVTIYYFSSNEDFRAYLSPVLRLNKNVGGFYSSRSDRALIVLPPPYERSDAAIGSYMAPRSNAAEAQHAIFHEYIHHLTHIAGDRPALWYEEGIAELVSTIKEEKDGFVLGLPVASHVRYLEWVQFNRWIPLKELFATGYESANYHEGERAGSFYAESWALLHFWLFGHSGLSADSLAKFLDYSRQHQAPGNAMERKAVFEQATGMDYQAMDEKLKQYINHGKYAWQKLPLPVMAGREAYTVRALTREEILGRLVELDYRMNRTPSSKLALIEGAEREPDNPRRDEVLGAEALADMDVDEARDRWTRAFNSGSTNAAVIHSLAMLENERWLTDIDLIYFRLPEPTGIYLRKLLHVSIAATPNQSEAYEMLAWVEATSEKPQIENVNLVQRHFGSLVQKAQTVLALALVRVRTHDEAGAREILSQLEKAEPGEECLKSIEVIRRFLDHPIATEPASEPHG